MDCPTFDCMHMVMGAATVSVFGRKQAEGVRSSKSVSVSPDVVLNGGELEVKVRGGVGVEDNDVVEKDPSVCGRGMDVLHPSRR